MQFAYTDDKLTITVDAQEQASLLALREEDPDSFGTDNAMVEQFEHLLSNSELRWINPEDTGDLTSAPMLGILGEETTKRGGPFGHVYLGRWGNPLKERYQPIVNRWGFMEYQLRSPLVDLADNGKVEFVARH